jgi:hypothetical protein
VFYSTSFVGERLIFEPIESSTPSRRRKMREENPSSTSNLIYHEEGREYFPVHLQLDSHLLLLHSQMNPCINPFPCASILPLPLSLFGTRQEKWTAPRVRLGGSAPKPKPSALCSSTLSEFLASGVPLFQNVAGIGVACVTGTTMYHSLMAGHRLLAPMFCSAGPMRRGPRII